MKNLVNQDLAPHSKGCGRDAAEIQGGRGTWSSPAFPFRRPSSLLAMPPTPPTLPIRRLSSRLEQMQGLNSPSLSSPSRPLTRSSSVSTTRSAISSSASTSTASVLPPPLPLSSYLTLPEWLSRGLAPIRGPKPRRWRGRQARGRGKQGNRKLKEGQRGVGDYRRQTRADEAGCWVLPAGKRKRAEGMIKKGISEEIVRE